MRVYFYFPLERQTALCHEMARHLRETRGWHDFAGTLVVSRGPTVEYMRHQSDVEYQHLDTVEDIEGAALGNPLAAENIALWEKRLECPLWHLVVADRNIGRVFVNGGRILHTQFSRIADHQHISRQVGGYLDFFQARLEAFRPDLVFLPVSAALHSLVLVRVCQWMQIPFFTLRHTRVLDRHIITVNDATERFHAVERRFQDLLAQPQKATPNVEAERYYNSFQSSVGEKPGYTLSLSRAQLTMREKSPIRFWGGIGLRLAQMAYRWATSRDASKRPVRSSNPLEEWWLETRRIVGVRYSHESYAEPSRIGDEPYVYYPLHMNPEASTMVRAPNFTNQLAIVEVLAKNIPMTHKLYVKEHPAMLGRRPSGFHEAIREYPNVRLLSSAENSLELSRHAALVVVITGTAGWEAIMLGKAVLMFGDAYYTALGASERCADLGDLGHQIRRLLDTQPNRSNRQRVLLFLSALLECSFPLPTEVLWLNELRLGHLGTEEKQVAHIMADELVRAYESHRVAAPMTEPVRQK